MENTNIDEPVKTNDGQYSTRIVRFEGLGGGGSVGEVKTWVHDYPLSPSNLWIPEANIPVKQEDVSLFQTRVRTRGTGASGAVINYSWNFYGPTLPFSIPQTGSPTILRDLVIQNF